MRATSSSSVISRESRSASACTVLSISFFCSSLSRSHLLSSVETKPLTPVSGERSSWATVATRSERSRSSRARPRPERITSATLSTGPNRTGRLIRPVTSTSVPVGGQPRLLGQADPVAEAVVRRVAGVPVTALLVLERDHLAEVVPGDRGGTEEASCRLVDDGDGAVGVRDDDSVGEGVEQRGGLRVHGARVGHSGVCDDLAAVRGVRQLEVVQGVHGACAGEVPAGPAVLLGRRVVQRAGRLLGRQVRQRRSRVGAQPAEVGPVDLAGLLVALDVVLARSRHRGWPARARAAARPRRAAPSAEATSHAAGCRRRAPRGRPAPAIPRTGRPAAAAG